MRAIGIDVGARQLHAVAIDRHKSIVDAAVLDAQRPAEAVSWVGAADAVAIDSPDAWSTRPHDNDTDPTLSQKFRTARCGEIALGREHGIWVPWVTPAEPVEGWIRVGVDLFVALRTAGHRPVEVYPHAVFCLLGDGRRPPPKRRPAGARARIDLLESAGVTARSTTSHDAIDAAAAALVALHHAQGTARAVTCGHDGSAIWLPPSPAGVAEASTSAFGAG